MRTKIKVGLVIVAILLLALIPLVLPRNVSEPVPSPLTKVNQKTVSATVLAPKVAAVPASASADPAGTVVDPDRPLPGAYPRPRLDEKKDGGYDDEAHYRNIYGNLFQKLKFTSKQEEAFIKILLEPRALQQGVDDALNAMMQKMRNRGIDSQTAYDEFRKQIDEQLVASQPKMNALRKQMDGELKQLFSSEDNYNYYLKYNNGNTVRQAVTGNFEDALAAANLPGLSVEQQEALVALVLDSIQPDDVGWGPIINRLPETVDQAVDVLTPQQLEVLKANPGMFLTPVGAGVAARMGRRAQTQ